MATSKGLLIILSGPSGVGKGTVRKKVMKDKSLDLVYSISMTTRPPRKGEVDGVDYYFVSDEVFNKNIKEGNFLEHTEFVGHQYGTPKDKIQTQIDEGHNVILEIEVDGANQVLKKVKGIDNCISIFLLPPNAKALEKRIRKRKSEDEPTLRARIEKGISEINAAKSYQYVVFNNSVRKSANEIRSIIRLEILKSVVDTPNTDN